MLNFGLVAPVATFAPQSVALLVHTVVSTGGHLDGVGVGGRRVAAVAEVRHLERCGIGGMVVGTQVERQQAGLQIGGVRGIRGLELLAEHALRGPLQCADVRLGRH